MDAQPPNFVVLAPDFKVLEEPQEIQKPEVDEPEPALPFDQPLEVEPEIPIPIEYHEQQYYTQPIRKRRWWWWR